MESSNSPRPPRRLQARGHSASSGACGVSDDMHLSPFSSNLSRSPSKPTCSKKPNTTIVTDVAPPRRSLSSKENSNSILRAAISQRLSFSEFGVAERRSSKAAVAAAAATSGWALSPGRAPLPRGMSEMTEPRRRRGVDGDNIGGGGLLGMFMRRRKEAPEKEAAAHRLRTLTARLLQWRFTNARMEKAMAGAKSAAENKLFYTWLRVAELRNILAAKRIMAQRRKQKLKLVRVLRPQVPLLLVWEPMAKQHADAVAVLGCILSAACTSLPVADGAQANLVQLHGSMSVSMDTVNDIEANAEMFYSKANMISSTLGELVETIQLEMEGLEEMMRLSRVVTRLQVDAGNKPSSKLNSGKAKVRQLAQSLQLSDGVSNLPLSCTYSKDDSSIQEI